METSLIPRCPRFGPPGARGHFLRWGAGEGHPRTLPQLETLTSVCHAASRASGARRSVSGRGKAEAVAAGREGWGRGSLPAAAERWAAAA